MEKVNGLVVGCKGGLDWLGVLGVVGLRGIGEGVRKGFGVDEGRCGRLGDFGEEMSVKGVIMNGVVGGVVVWKGIVGVGGVNVVGMFWVCVG